MAIPSKKHQSSSQTLSQQQNQGKHPKNSPAKQDEIKLQPIDVDELAREKVNEIEKSLESAASYKLAEINVWFLVLKQIITAADLHRTHDGNDQNLSDKSPNKPDSGESIYADYADDNEQFNAVDLTEQLATNPVKWTIRVQAFKIVHRLVEIASQLNPATTSSRSASTTDIRNNSQYLLSLLPDLVRLSFVAATSPYDDLKIQGFEMFKFIIKKFASVEEKELKGQLILEQYRAQILSALKPAFDLDAPPYIAAIASQVCSLWIGLAIDRNVNDLTRTHQLFLASIDKLEQQSTNQHSKLYTESELEQERLDILGSWAHILIACYDNETIYATTDTNIARLSSELKNLVNPCVDVLIDKWWEALKDYALLIMPAPRLINSPHENDSVYTREVALRLFHPIWPKLTLASAIWLCKMRCSEENNDEKIKKDCDTSHVDPIRCSKFICGIVMKELCDCQLLEHPTRRSLTDSTIHSIKALYLLLNSKSIREEIVNDTTITRELYLLLYGTFAGNSKDPNRGLIKRCMDTLYSAELSKISEKSPDATSYSLAQLMLMLEEQLQVIQEQADEKSRDSSTEHRTRLFIVMSNLITTLEVGFDQISGNTYLLSRVIKNLRMIIELEADRTLGLILLSLLQDLYTNLKNNEKSSYLIAQVYASKLNQLSRALNSTVLARLDLKTVQATSIPLDTCLKSMLFDLNICSNDDSRKSMLNDLASALLEPLQRIKEFDIGNNSKTTLEKVRDSLELIVKPIKDIQASYVEDINEPNRASIEKVMQLSRETNEKLTKLNKPLTNSESLGTKKVRPQMKITLKADFSNFYTQKL